MVLANIFHSGGAWLIPLILLILVVVLVRAGLKSWKSGSVSLPSSANPSGTDYGTARAPWYRVWQFIFAIILAVGFLWALITIINDYQGV